MIEKTSTYFLSYNFCRIFGNTKYIRCTDGKLMAIIFDPTQALFHVCVIIKNSGTRTKNVVKLRFLCFEIAEKLKFDTVITSKMLMYFRIVDKILKFKREK